MKWFLYLVSIAWIAGGAYAILYTSQWKNLLKKLLENTNRLILEGTTVAVGLLLLFSASSSRVPAVVAVIGLIAIGKGVLLYINPSDVFEKTRQWYLQTLTDQAHRLIGIVSLVLGTAVLSWVR